MHVCIYICSNFGICPYLERHLSNCCNGTILLEDPPLCYFIYSDIVYHLLLSNMVYLHHFFLWSLPLQNKHNHAHSKAESSLAHMPGQWGEGFSSWLVACSTATVQLPQARQILPGWQKITAGTWNSPHSPQAIMCSQRPAILYLYRRGEITHMVCTWTTIDSLVPCYRVLCPLPKYIQYIHSCVYFVSVSLFWFWSFVQISKRTEEGFP